MVDSSRSGRSAKRMKCTAWRGSSSVLSSALAAPGTVSGNDTSARGKMKNVACASKGAYCASGRISSRRYATCTLPLPSSRGSNTRTSGWLPLSTRCMVSGLAPSCVRCALASASAASCLPTPAGPSNRYDEATRPVRSADVSTDSAWGCAWMPSK
jgi:hypothetical protein